MEDLEDAILSHCEALSLCPLGNLYRSSSLSSLGTALHTRYAQSGRMPQDLEDAISFHYEALTLCPLGHPHHCLFLHNLARAIFSRYNQSSMVEDLDKSFSLYEQGTNELTSSLQHQLVAAIDWVAKAQLYHHRSLVKAYSTTLHLLDHCLILHPDVESQQKFLAAAHIPRSLASNAASAAINAGDLKVAVELLEQGRAILWSKMEGYRHPLDRLCQVDKQLADLLQNLSMKLEHFSLSRSVQLDTAGTMGPVALEAQLHQHRILSEDWERAVKKVRKLDGFSDFLQAIPFSTLQMAAAEGPVILINISNYRSDAIILYGNSLPILVTLPQVYCADLTHFSKQLALARDTRTGMNHSKSISSILRTLWNNIVSPVIDHLAEMGVPEKSRIWWCPTSELCALPLHAAGPYQRLQKNLPDIYISSYISTLSALIRARSNTTFGQSVVPKLLVVGQPCETLPNVQNEIDNVQQLGAFVDVIVGAEANHDKVLHGLQHHSWAHFACHGHLGDNSQPFHASFELYGGSYLTLLDLIQARLPNAELAFLSACHSAEGDFITPDENIHLAAAMQFCGFRSVVGTLWAMDDQDGPIISKEFYKHMFRKPGNKADFRDSAEALNLATRTMRKSGEERGLC